jgi:hypothetical protein
MVWRTQFIQAVCLLQVVCVQMEEDASWDGVPVCDDDTDHGGDCVFDSRFSLTNSNDAGQFTIQSDQVDCGDDAYSQIYMGDTFEMGIDDGCASAVILRFTGVDLPRDARIFSAVLLLEANDVNTRTLVLRIQAEATGDALPLVSVPVNERSLPSDSRVMWEVPAWNSVDEIKQSADISPLLQEVVMRDDWSPPAAFAIRLEHFHGNAIRQAKAYSQDTQTPALIVRWGAPDDFGLFPEGDAVGSAVDCTGDWSAWSACSAACGGGSRERTYSVVVPARHGGQACASVAGEITATCNFEPCPEPPPPPPTMPTTPTPTPTPTVTALKHLLVDGGDGAQQLTRIDIVTTGIIAVVVACLCAVCIVAACKRRSVTRSPEVHLRGLRIACGVYVW